MGNGAAELRVLNQQDNNTTEIAAVQYAPFWAALQTIFSPNLRQTDRVHGEGWSCRRACLRPARGPPIESMTGLLTDLQPSRSMQAHKSSRCRAVPNKKVPGPLYFESGLRHPRRICEIDTLRTLPIRHCRLAHPRQEAAFGVPFITERLEAVLLWQMAQMRALPFSVAAHIQL